MPLYKASDRYSATLDGAFVTFAAGDVLELDATIAGRISRDVGRRILERVPPGTQPDPRPAPAAPEPRKRPAPPVVGVYTVQRAYRAGVSREGPNLTGPDWRPGDRVELTDREAAYRERDSPGLLDPTPVQPEPVEQPVVGDLMPPPYGGNNPMGVWSTGH